MRSLPPRMWPVWRRSVLVDTPWSWFSNQQASEPGPMLGPSGCANSWYVVVVVCVNCAGEHVVIVGYMPEVAVAGWYSRPVWEKDSFLPPGQDEEGVSKHAPTMRPHLPPPPVLLLPGLLPRATGPAGTCSATVRGGHGFVRVR